MPERATSTRLPDDRFLRAYAQLRRRQPYRSAHDAAPELGVSEAEVVAASVDFGEAFALKPDPAGLLAEVPALGPVTAISHSPIATLSCDGAYGAPDIGEHTGIVIGRNIDLRIFPSGWKFAYAVSRETPSGLERSLQIFDAAGTAAHEIRLRPQGDAAAFERLTRAFAGGGRLELAADRPAASAAEEAIDVAAYRAAYAGMRDTHDFFMLLRRFGLAREQVLRLADEAFARPLPLAAHRDLFARAAAECIPLMLFVANEGIVQISSGRISQPVYSGTSCMLAGPESRLALREDGIARAWAVRKPTVNGIVTSLELYAADGTLGLQIFGERHEGSGERPDWARAIQSLSTADELAH